MRDVFGQPVTFMNHHSGFRLIRIQSSHKGTVIPSPGHPGCKMHQMTTVIANPGGPGRRNLVPRNKFRQKSSPLLNHFSRLPEISAQRKGWCPLLSTSGRLWQILSTSVHFFTAFSCNHIKTIVELYMKECLICGFKEIYITNGSIY